ncbi:MAG: tannase/feruloyl esterase family alpha/beta hydrolase [Phascolarctobacterium sp.]|nr:tannase/feruloyl esterase family alpha/beta hydrolase [Phascolarctobacterium sp.]
MLEEKFIPASAFELPTNGAKILSVELKNVEGLNNLKFYKVLGKILPVDKNAPVINFEVNLPLGWNGKLVQFGGGGFNGHLISGLGAVCGEKPAYKTPLARGYATCGSDSGHINTFFWDLDWALNEECLRNFGHEHIKKTKDAAVYILQNFYGCTADKIFFAGSSNGGREALMCAQRYPKDYDGLLVGYPVYNWVPKILTDYRNMQAMDELGPEGFLSATEFIEAYKIVQELCEEKGCMKDGLVRDFYACDALKDEALKRMSKVFNEKQIAALKNFYEPMEFAFELANGVKRQQGFSIVQQFCDHKMHPFGKIPGARDGLFAKTVDQIVRFQIMKDAGYDTKLFDYKQHREEVLRLSEIMDATNYKLDIFSARGGKVLMFQGTNDQLLTLHATIDYYKKVCNYLGEQENNFIKLFLFPGFAHDYGEVFDMHADLLAALDKWVETDKAPEEFIAIDQNEKTKGRTQIVKAFQ